LFINIRKQIESYGYEVKGLAYKTKKNTFHSNEQSGITSHVKRSLPRLCWWTV